LTPGVLLDALAVRDPQAVVLQGADAAWTASVIRDAMAQLAALLQKDAGIVGGKAGVLAILADNSPAWVIADLVVLQAGVPHLPLPGFFSPAQMVHALQQTGTTMLLTDQPARIAALDLDFVPVGEWCGLVLLRRDVQAVPLPAGTAKISFTSGSTGAPKGVCLSATGLLETAAAVAKRLSGVRLERHLAVLPLALLLENVAGVHASLLQGSTIHLPPLSTLGWQGMAGFDPAALHHSVTARHATSVILVPELLKAWTLYLGKVGAGAPADLVYAAVGGAKVDKDLLQQARAFGLPAYQGYGLTECGSVVSLNRLGDDGEEGADAGRPLDHVRIRIDAAGEIHVMANAFLGYLNEVPVAMGSEYATGDLGEWAEQQHLCLSGRRKHLLINSYGRNISPEWVEAALLAEPDIAQALVTGEGRPWLAALLVPTPGSDGDALAAAVRRVNQGLPDYARITGWVMVPPFTTANGLATGNGRPVRANILKEYHAALAALYAEKELADVVL